MIDYPYDFGNGYKVQAVYANKTDTGGFGNVYDFRSEAEHSHPGEEILIGYCVIDEALGLVPDRCNDWNDTVSDAIRDYEEHIVPLLECEETMEMNCPVYDLNDNLLYEANFTCKSGWLQDYFGVDNHCQLEAIWDVGDSWESPENFTDAFKEANLSGFQITALTRDNVKVEWAAIGEGLWGDYNPLDPKDVELLRFYVYVLRDGVWEEKEDAGYCTQFPASASEDEKLAGLEILLERFYDVLSADIDASVKKLGEQMSWIDPSSVSGRVMRFNKSLSIQSESNKYNAADNLIKAMVMYGQERSWSNDEIIKPLIELGITYDDFCHAGLQDFVNGYLKPSLSVQLRLASNDNPVHFIKNSIENSRDSENKHINDYKNDTSEYAVFVKLCGVIYVDAASEEQAARIAEYSANADVSWDEWFSVEDVQVEKKLSLSDQIKSASTRVAETQSTETFLVKALDSER